MIKPIFCSFFLYCGQLVATKIAKPVPQQSCKINLVSALRWLLNRLFYMHRGENETDRRDKTRNSPGCYQLTKVTSQKTICRCFAVLVKNDNEMPTNAKYAPNLNLN